MNDLQVCVWPIDRVIPYARNARKIPQKAIDKVAASIKEFGWRQPIVVDPDGVVVVGHTRLLAARKLSLADVPVHVAALWCKGFWWGHRDDSLPLPSHALRAPQSKTCLESVRCIMRM